MSYVVHFKTNPSGGRLGDVRVHDVNIVAAGAAVTYCGKHFRLEHDDYELVEELQDGFGGDACLVCEKATGSSTTEPAHE